MTSIWIVLAFLAGGLIGVLLALLINRKTQMRAALAEQQAMSFREQLAVATGELTSARSASQNFERTSTQATTTLTNLREQEKALTAQLNNERVKFEEASKIATTAIAERDALKIRLDEQQKSIETALQQMRDQFASLSQETLTRSSEQFLQLATEKFQQLSTSAAGTLDERKVQIDAMLTPLKESLGTYQQRLAQIETARQEGYGKLLEQLGTMSEIGRKLDLQTTQLVTALRRPSTRGRWGELTLRRLIELAGLSQHCDFTEQAQTDSDESRLRPDLVVHVSNGGQVVVDAKATLEAFLDATVCDDESQKLAHLTRHAQAVRSRAQQLAQKAYWNQFDRAPEFVVMFLPAEAFLYAAVERDTALIEDAMKSNVIIATPTTLIALLKTFAFGWRQEQLAKNAEEIKKAGIELYDRVNKVAEHLLNLGKSIGKSVEQYNSTVSSFDGRMLVSARRMGELGTRGDRELTELRQIDLQPRLTNLIDSVASTDDPSED